MNVTPRKPTKKAAAERFSGDVWFGELLEGEEPSRLRMSTVYFSPGARTAWHSHSLGQALYVTEGVGRIQARGGEVITLRAGDAIFAPANEWHWHGAAPDSMMTHLAISEEDLHSGSEKTSWGDKVTDAEYLRE